MSDPGVFDPSQDEPRSKPLLRRMLGDVLRRVRREQGRTLADVARAARVSMPYLSEVERGRKEASSEVLAAICDALYLDLSDVLAEVWRDLVADRAARADTAPVIRIDVARRRGGTSAGAHRPGDVQCALAA